MRYRKLSTSQDMMFGHQQADYFRDSPETVQQAVVTRLRLFTGEWFLDVEEGTPYQAGVLGKHTVATASEAIRTRILDTQGVTSLLSFDVQSDSDTRTLSVSAKIDTIYGVAQLNEVL